MKLKTAFEIGQSVQIVSLGLVGKITGIYVDRAGHQYNVRYFQNADPKTSYFDPEELTAPTPHLAPVFSMPPPPRAA